MWSSNIAIVAGNVGQVPRRIGKSAKVNVATNRTWLDETGARKTATDWVTITVLNKSLIDYVLTNIGKGDRVMVRAHIVDSSYVKDEKTIYSTDIIADDIAHFNSKSSAGELG